MKYLYTLAVILFFAVQGIAQEEVNEEVRESTFGLTLTMENAFGFYPVIYGSVGLSPSLDLIYYGVMWTNPSFGLPQTTFSSDLWIENGFGLGFHILDENIYVNPSIGFGHGKFLSGGDQSVAFEGIIPSLSLYISPGNMDTEVYFSLYRHLRDEVTDPVNRATSDFIFYWITPGYWVSKNFSMGVHYEAVYLKYGDFDYESSYQWLGPYIKIKSKGKYEFRFAAGANLKEGIYADEFYKITTNIPF